MPVQSKKLIECYIERTDRNTWLMRRVADDCAVSYEVPLWNYSALHCAANGAGIRVVATIGNGPMLMTSDHKNFY